MRELREPGAAAKVGLDGSLSRVPMRSPRFRMQGSRVYQTLNRPAHQPPQEVDYDDGMYLPVSFVSNGGQLTPEITANTYRNAVSLILNKLCEKNGWKFSKKPNCLRVTLGSGAHIDLALYAVPDKSFTSFQESALDIPQDARRLPRSVYEAFSETEIMLAQEGGSWIESDPRKIEAWFRQAVAVHGEVLTRISRYVKGWRDHQWQDGGPSSIALMACVVRVLDELKGPLEKNRDDLALHTVADRLNELMAGPITIEDVVPKPLDKEWTPHEREEYRDRAWTLADEVERVLSRVIDRQRAILILRDQFGERIPWGEHLIEIDMREHEVLSAQPKIIPAAMVPPTTSG